MQMLSGRVPDDLYQWFVNVEAERTLTNSDKLRVLLAQLKRQYDGSLDYVSALAWFRDLAAPLRQNLGVLERDLGKQSEVVTTLIEQIGALAATVVSAHPKNEVEAAALEDTLVRRVFAMTEALLRQGITKEAAAYDASIVRKHSKRTIELATLVQVEEKRK
jgi:hypothetical protein